MAKRSVAVRISGHEYRIRSDADEAWLQRVAGCVDAAMSQIRDRTGTVDTLDLAILTSLNLARQVLALRARVDRTPESGGAVAEDRLRALIELAEGALGEAGRRAAASPGRGGQDASDTPLLTLPAGDELEDDVQEELLAPMMEAFESGDLVEGTSSSEGAGDGASRGRR